MLFTKLLFINILTSPSACLLLVLVFIFSCELSNLSTHIITIIFIIQVGDTLKRFAANITTSKVNERKNIFEDLKSCIENLGYLFMLKNILR